MIYYHHRLHCRILSLTSTGHHMCHQHALLDIDSFIQACACTPHGFLCHAAASSRALLQTANATFKSNSSGGLSRALLLLESSSASQCPGYDLYSYGKGAIDGNSRRVLPWQQGTCRVHFHSMRQAGHTSIHLSR